MNEEKGEIFDDLVNFKIAQREAETYFTDDLKRYLNWRRVTMQNLLDASDEEKPAYMKVLHNINTFIKDLLKLA